MGSSVQGGALAGRVAKPLIAGHTAFTCATTLEALGLAQAGLGDDGQVAGLRTGRQPHSEVSGTLPACSAGRVPPEGFAGDQFTERRQASRRGWRQNLRFLPAGQ